MKRSALHLGVTVAVLSLAACKETSSPSPLFNEATVTGDVATNSGDAMATTVAGMVLNETAAALPAPGVAFDLFGTKGNGFTYSRSRTCYDSTGTVVAGCTPMSAVRKVITTFTVSGTRTDTNAVTGGATTILNGAVHRAGTDTLVRTFASGTEKSRSHSSLATAHDTTTFTNGTVTRTHDEAAIDSARGVTWNLPRSSNPFPVSGYIVRIDTVHVTFTSATTTASKTEVKIVKITFPPDAQGNVTLQIDNKTCTLNLVTHKVSNCH
jgi:hypothetical protein